MMPISPLLVMGVGWVLAFTATRLVRSIALKRQVFDLPNERSAHVTPTPRLGGIGIMAGFLPGAVALNMGSADPAPLLIVVAATAAIALLGLVDDLTPLPARWRFAVQTAAAAVVVLSRRQAIVAVAEPFGLLLPGPLLELGAVLWIVWATNLYNFMDGIDGLAGGQAVIASAGLAAAAFQMGDPLVGWALLVLAVASAGFLPSNLPKASIFMGDVGSTAIGFFLASVPFASASRPLPAMAVILALSFFVLDATSTLVRRVIRGEKWFAAHRTHLYQRPLALGASHARITYTAWTGMVLVAGMAAMYPSVGGAVRALMMAVAVSLFLLAVLVVGRLERAHAAAGAAARARGEGSA